MADGRKYNSTLTGLFNHKFYDLLTAFYWEQLKGESKGLHQYLAT